MSHGFWNRRARRPAGALAMLFWVAALTPGAAVAAGVKLFVMVSYTPDNAEASPALWGEVVKLTNSSAFFANATPLIYKTEDELVPTVQGAVNGLGAGDCMLVLGPPSTGEAQKLGLTLTNLNTNCVLFVSPTITTASNSFNGLPLVRACLPDLERIQNLHRFVPAEWRQMPAALLAMDDAWGQQLQTSLSLQTNLFSTLSPCLVPIASATNADKSITARSTQIATFADQAFSRRDALIYVALENSSDVAEFLAECHRRGSFFAPYKPMICLLQDYQFDHDGSGKTINTAEAAQWFPITVVSDTVEEDKFPGSDERIQTNGLYASLDADFVAIIGHLAKSGADYPRQFFDNIHAVFERRTLAQKLIGRDAVNGGVAFKTSQYFVYLQGGDDDPLIVKWLQSSWRHRLHLPVAAGRATWVSVEDEDLPNKPWLVRAKFFDDILCARIPWFGNGWLVLIALGLLILGLLIEIRKRFIFVCRNGPSLGGRIAAWSGIVLLTFAALVYLALGDMLHVTNYAVLLGICISPLVVFSALQNTVLARIPVLKGLLEWPTEQLEDALDVLVNSRAKKLLARYRQQIEATLAAEAGPQNWTEAQQENYLWNWWFDSLRLVKPEARAKKILDRFLPRIEVWDKTLNVQTRLDGLKEALAYTSMVIGENGGE